MPYQARSGDIISLDSPRLPSLTMSVPLSQYTPAGVEDPISQFARRDAFRTVAELIASSIAAIPFDVYQESPLGRIKLGADEHPVAATLDEPVAGQTQYRFIEQLMLDMVLHDRWAFLVLPTDTGGYRFIRLPGAWMSFGLDARHTITHGILTNRDGRKLDIPLDMLVFDVGYDPYNSDDATSGMPIARTLGAAARELEKGAAWREALLDQGPKVPMYIKRPLEAPDWIKNGGRTRFTESFKAFSSERAGQTPVLEDGMELAAAPQLNADAVAYRETRLAAQIDYAISMHVPPELVGYRQGNYSNIDALREQLYVDVLQSKILAFRQALNGGLRRAGALDAQHWVEDNVGIRLASTPEKQAQILQTQTGAPVRTVNEARRMLNLPPVPGGDELIVPLNVTRGGLASPTDTGPKARPALDRAKAARPMFALAAGHDQASDTAALRLVADLREYFGRQAGRVLKALGDGDSPGSLATAFDVDLEVTDLSGVLYAHSVAIANLGADSVLDVYNPDREGFAYDVLQPWLSKAANGTATGIVSNEQDAVSAVLFGVDDWRGEVGRLYDQTLATAPEFWGRTVQTSAFNFGSADAAKASGLGFKTWKHVAGKTSRSEHAAMDGQKVPIGDVFSNGARWPGDPGVGPDENAQCRCRVVFSRD